MSDVLIHHVLGAGWNFLALAFVATLVARLWLSHRLENLAHPADFDSPDVLAALVLPALLPLTWLASSIVHLMEPGQVVDHCCAVLAGLELSASEVAFGAGIVSVMIIQFFSFRRRWRRGHRSHSDADGRERRRVRRLCETGPLADVTVRVVDCDSRSCMTRGMFRPWIEISAGLCRELDDDALEAALLHEAGHAAMLDPLRSTLLLASQILNPFAATLTRYVEAWRFGAEVGRDVDAVRFGAHPVAMADALVTAAHCQSGASLVRCHLHGGQDALEARVHLLLNAGATPLPARTDGLAVLTAFLVAGVALPHVLGARLFALHCLLERLLS